jgi:hypothetical protein
MIEVELVQVLVLESDLGREGVLEQALEMVLVELVVESEQELELELVVELEQVSVEWQDRQSN